MLHQLCSLIRFSSFHILIVTKNVILHLTIQSVIDGFTTGTLQMFKASDISPLLFNNEISRKMMVSNLYHSLGGEWSFIARSIERNIYYNVCYKHIKLRTVHHSP